jgi:hypothetical protein
MSVEPLPLEESLGEALGQALTEEPESAPEAETPTWAPLNAGPNPPDAEVDPAPDWDPVEPDQG